MRFLGVVLAVLVGIVQAHNELLPPKGKVCYHEDLDYGDRFEVSFQVGTRDATSSEQLDVDFGLFGPQGNRLIELSHVADGRPELHVSQKGTYEFCFSNEYSSISTKDITFHVKGAGLSESRKEAYQDNLEGQIKLLSRLVQDVQHEQAYIVIRERVHRNTAESTNDRVKYWSLFQILVVVANTLFQVFYLKRFFEVKSNV